MNDINFWNDKTKSEQTIKELNNLKETYTPLLDIKNKIKDLLELLEIILEEELDSTVLKELEEIEKNFEKIKINLLLNKEHDSNNAIVEIHSGAGGTEACDWVNMLYRMYTRWCEKKDYKITILSEIPGEETGYKTVTFIVKGKNAYGYLKEEKGVHRLVRISPFDSGARRHTSFASITVTPEIEEDINIDINETDLKIDVYRSSGCGGQGVNTTDSAVRITHLPTKIVVTCQNERSQIKNKEIALNVLKNKLYELEQQKNKQRLNDLKGNLTDNGFGSQIRSYVMHPYSLVKDHRTNYENTNVLKVLDGDIDDFIIEKLKRG